MSKPTPEEIAAATELPNQSRRKPTPAEISAAGEAQPPEPYEEPSISAGYSKGYVPPIDYEKLPLSARALSYPLAALSGYTSGAFDIPVSATESALGPEKYSDVKRQWERIKEVSDAEHPLMYLTGALAPAGASKLASAGAKLVGGGVKTAKALSAALSGAASGFGQSKNDDDDTVARTLGGAALGLGGLGLMEGAGAAAKEFGPKLKGLAVSQFEQAAGARTPELRRAYLGAADKDARAEQVAEMAMRAYSPTSPGRKIVDYGVSTADIQKDMPQLAEAYGGMLGDTAKRLESFRKIIRQTVPNDKETALALYNPDTAAAGYKTVPGVKPSSIARQLDEMASAKRFGENTGAADASALREQAAVFRRLGKLGGSPRTALHPGESLPDNAGVMVGEQEYDLPGILGAKREFNYPWRNYARLRESAGMTPDASSLEAKVATRGILGKAGDEQVEALGYNAGRPDVSEEFRDYNKLFGLADSGRRMVQGTLRDRGNNSLSMTDRLAAILGAAVSPIAAPAALMANVFGRKYGNAAVARALFDASEGGAARKIMAGGAAVGKLGVPMSRVAAPAVRAYGLKDEQTEERESFEEWLKKQPLDEEEAKKHFNDSGG